MSNTKTPKRHTPHATKVTIIEDGCSALPGYDAQAREFVGDMKQMGLTVCNFSDLTLS